MSELEREPVSDGRAGVAAIYEAQSVADSYLEKRMRFGWQRLLHRRQVALLNRAIFESAAATVLELAPGPARVSVDVCGVTRGVMVENSEAMIGVARRRLKERGLDDAWSVVSGSAFELGTAIGSQRFDLVYTFRFIRHFGEADRGLLYRGIRECLNERGWLVFDVVNKPVREALDRNRTVAPKEELDVFDVSYTAQSFQAEMSAHGFSVVGLHPVLTRFGLQSWLSYKGDDISPALVDLMVAALERIPGRMPLEWVAVCQKT